MTISTTNCTPILIGIEQDTDKPISFKYVYSCALCENKECQHNISDEIKEQYNSVK